MLALAAYRWAIMAGPLPGYQRPTERLGGSGRGAIAVVVTVAVFLGLVVLKPWESAGVVPAADLEAPGAGRGGRFCWLRRDGHASKRADDAAVARGGGGHPFRDDRSRDRRQAC